VAYLAVLLALEMAAEFWWVDQAPAVQALMRWSLLALAIAPLSAVIAWRAHQADRTIQAVTERDAERDLVRRLALELTAEYQPGAVPGLLLRQVRELSGARLAFLASPAGDDYQVEMAAGDDTARLVGHRLPIGDQSPGIAGDALRSGRPTFLSDTWCDQGLASRRELGLSDKIRSAAAVPLVVRGEVVALIGLHSDRIGQIDEERAGLLELYAEQAAGPFENSLLTASVSQLDAAKQLDQLKSEFLSAVAHELRAPLSPMLGWSELLLMRDYAPEQARPMLQNIYDGARHMSVLVGDLLDLSKGEAGRLKLDVEETELAELLDSAVERQKEMATSHHFVLAATGGLPIKADRHRLRQVFDNLLSNAVKYSQPGTRVFVTARTEPDGTAVVRISDQGLGLTQEECDRLFSKFYRTDSARKFASGTGLGLALCKLIVEAHGGTIKVESEGPGLGSAFSFSLPQGGPPSEAAQRAEFATIKG
jgi:signal transduction histidine kinase